MPKIHIPDNCVPEGAEIVEGGAIDRTGVYWGGQHNSHMTICIPIRRKHVLTAVVFEIAGPPRQIKPGEWYIETKSYQCMRNDLSVDTFHDHVPVNRREVFSCQ